MLVLQESLLDAKAVCYFQCMGGPRYELELFWIISGGLTGILLDFCDLHFNISGWPLLKTYFLSLVLKKMKEGER